MFKNDFAKVTNNLIPETVFFAYLLLLSQPNLLKPFYCITHELYYVKTENSVIILPNFNQIN